MLLWVFEGLNCDFLFFGLSLVDKFSSGSAVNEGEGFNIFLLLWFLIKKGYEMQLVIILVFTE